MKKILLSAQKRAVKKNQNKELRATNKIPAIVYGHDLKGKALTLDSKRFEEVFSKAGTSAIIDLKTGTKQTYKVIIHEIQFDPVTDEVIHVDFYKVKMDQAIRTEIPLEFTGKSPSVEDDGGSLILDREEIEIEALPTDLIDRIKVDISVLKTFDDVIRIKDLNIPNKIKVLNQPEEVVATTTAPRSEEELEELEEAPTESDVEDVEVETEKEDEETEEGEETDTPKEEAPKKAEKETKS